MFRGPHRAIAFILSAWLMLPAAVRADDTRELKPIATARDNERTASIGLFLLTREGVVIRSAEELVALTDKAESAKDPAVQKEMEAYLAKLLKVEAIDWKKQIVIGAICERFESLTSDGKRLTITFVPFSEPGGRAVPPTPKILLLIERVEGDVKLVKRKALDPRELKPIATARDNAASASFGLFLLTTEGVVIRSAEELVGLTDKAKSAREPAVQKEMEAELAKLLKVESIDWKKQIVIGVIGERFESLTRDGKGLTATFVPFREPGGRAAPPAPKILVLIERVEGEVKFVKKKAPDPKELKPIATARDNERSASIGSFELKTAGVVIRSAEELVALTDKAKSAKDPAVQKEMEAELARLLKVERIDWQKQIVIGVIGEGFESLTRDGKGLTATFVPVKETTLRRVPRTPKTLVLIERIEGDVKFVKKK
jgi:hypothetical protein